MKRNHTMLFIGAALIALLMGSCDTLFTNQFETLGLGQVSLQMIEDAVAGGTDAIIAESGLEEGGISPSFLAAATATPETAKLVTDELQETVNDTSAPPEERQAAQVLIIEIELEMNGGNDLIDNIVGAIGGIDLDNFNIGDPTDLANLLASLFPPKGVRALPEGWTVEDVAAVLDGIAASQDRFAELVTFMVDGGYSVPGIDAGRLAQVGIIANILDRVDPVSPYASTGIALATLIEAATTNPEIINPWAYIVQNTELINEIKADPALQELFTAAGLDLVALLNTFGA